MQVLKLLETSLQHYSICVRVYNPTWYARRWGVAVLEMGMAFGDMADLIEKVKASGISTSLRQARLR